MKTKLKEVYYCEYCKKHGLSKYQMNYHESICSKNPENFRPCFNCIYLDKNETTITFDSYLGGVETKRNLLYCNKKEIFLYTPKNEAKGNQYELEDGNYPMPKECEHYQGARK